MHTLILYIFFCINILPDSNRIAHKNSYLAAVKVGDVYGFINPKGEYAIPLQYDKISPDNRNFSKLDVLNKRFVGFSSNYCEVHIDNQWYIINSKGEKIFNLNKKSYTSGYAFNQGYRVVQVSSHKCMSGAYGLIDSSGIVMTPKCVSYMRSFSEGLIAATWNYRKWGFYNLAGEVVIPFEYENAENFHDGLCAVKKNGKWGAIDTTGKEIIPFLYDYPFEFHEGLAAVSLADKYGYIDKTGKIIIPFEKEYPLDPSNLERERGIKSRDKVYATAFSEGIALIGVGINFRYLETLEFNQLVVFNPIEWRYIDTNGNYVFTHYYRKASLFENGYAVVKEGLKKYGVINKKGEYVVEPNFAYIGRFVNGLAPAKESEEGLWGYINLKSEWVISPQFDEAFEFAEVESM